MRALEEKKTLRELEGKHQERPRGHFWIENTEEE